MIYRPLILSTTLFFLWLPFAGAEVAPDTVVATMNGKQVTAADVERALAGAPTVIRERMQHDRREFLQEYALVSYLAEEGKKLGVERKSPYKEKLAWNREQVLMQAAIADKAAELKATGLSGEAAQAKSKAWLESLKQTNTVSFEDEAFFSDDPRARAAVPAEKVVVKVDGKPLTSGAVQSLLKGASSNVQENFSKQPKRFFRDFAMMFRLARVAEQKKLAGRSPYAEQLDWVRKNILMQGAVDTHSRSINIGPKEEREYYEAHQDKYTFAKVKVLYVAFGRDEDAGKVIDGKKVLSEAQAEEKIESVRRQVDSGADFVELVKKYSDDKTSRDKDGDFGTIHRSDKIPDHIKDAIFALKKGEVSQPVRQPNGFYLFRLEDSGLQSIDEVRQTMNRDAKGEKLKEWFDSVRAAVKVTFENEEFFAQAR